jgi:lysophospholipase L1-like esterase
MIKHINNIIREESYKHKVLLIDNDKIFDTKKGKNKQELFQLISEGDHPNQKGYNLMANSIYEKIINEKLLKDIK